MAWRGLRVSAERTHHVRAGAPAYVSRFREVLSFHEPGLAAAVADDGAMHIDVRGLPAYAVRFDRTFGFYEGWAAVQVRDDWFHVRPDGRPQSALRFAWCGNYQGGRCVVRTRDGRYFHLGSDGTPAYHHRWRYAGDYRDGAAVVQGEDGRHTHIDDAGSILHGRWFVDLDVFHKGFARARDEAGWTHVGPDGLPRYERRFAGVEPFYNGQARVERFDGGLEVIDERGEAIVELRPARGEPVPSGPGPRSAIEWVIPPSTSQWLDAVPADRPVAMLIRHSVRDHLPAGDAGYGLPLTDTGHRLALALGERLRGRLRAVHASPLLRTMQTASCLAKGAGLPGPPRLDTLLGDPGVFVVDGRAGDTWRRLGHEEVMRNLVEEREPLPGCASAEPAARFLVHHMLAAMGGVPGVHAFATHDSLVTATAARLLGEPLAMSSWPWYLEAAFFWEEDGKVHCAYRDWHGTRASPVVGLSAEDVTGFARREVAATVGLDCPARFFVAGGAFKTLLNGRPPRDLDLWAPSEADRTVLAARLRARGAQPLPEQPYTQGYRLGDRIIELPLSTQADSLEDLLRRFDLGLSAIGVEHRPGDDWRAVVHPLAHASVERREVLLLEELPNWKHSLTSLERMRRYARELGFTVPASQEARIWAIFDSQPRDVQASMVERFARTARHDQGVQEEVACRFR
jgi:broad specificity phosphatase PhoE